MHAIVGYTPLFTKYSNLELVFVRFFQQIFDEPVIDHAITDDGTFDSAYYCHRIQVYWAYLLFPMGNLLIRVNRGFMDYLYVM